MKSREKDKGKKITRRLYDFSKGGRRWVIVGLAGVILNVAVEIALAIFLKIIVNTALGGNSQELGKIVYGIVIIILAGVIAEFTRRYGWGRFEFHIVNSLRNGISRHIVKLPVAYMENNHSGDIVSRMTNDVAAIQEFFSRPFSGIIFLPVMAVCGFTYMAILNWKLLLSSVVLIPLAGFLVGFLSKPIQKNSKEAQEYLAEVNSIAQDTIGGIQILKAFDINEGLFKKYGEQVAKTLNKFLRVEKLQCYMAPVRIFLNHVPLIVCTIYGGYLTVNKQITPGDLMAFLQLLSFVVRPFSNLHWIATSIRKLTGAASHLFELLDEPAERQDGRNFKKSELSDIPLELEKVDFSYDGQLKILEDLSLKLENNMKIALVGSSGSGKTTVLKLICGFYRQQGGNIRLYGHELSQWNLQSARELISLVSQDTYVFPMSVAENIRYSKPDATMEEIVEASKIANAHEFITGLPEGYDTLVGERGIKLSGGQRQRVAIARAVLKKAPILLLDEPTSALDTESEYLVQEALDNFMRNSTAIIVAHRLSTIKGADLVLVIEGGKIAECGTHAELMEKGAIYRQLYMKQFADQDDEKEIA